MIFIWIGFVAFILSLLALDLGVFHRKAHVVDVKEALAWSAVWIAFGLSFSLFIYLSYENHWMGLGLYRDAMAISTLNPLGHNDGASATLKYLTGYVVEKSLSVDNIFVIATIFAMVGIPSVYRHRVLFWGVVGALGMRAVMIALGVKLISEFSWVIYIFGGLLILTGVKMLSLQSKSEDAVGQSLLKLARKWLPVAEGDQGQRFWVRVPGKGWAITSLFLALILVEFTDLIFAVDSIPAIFAITTDPFLVFTSNVFAILGLRSLYFALEGLINRFVYLKPALAFVLIVVGIKMLAHTQLKLWLGDSYNFAILGVVLGILGCGVAASLIKTSPVSAKVPADPVRSDA